VHPASVPPRPLRPSWRSTRSLSRFVGILIVAVVTALNFEWMPFLLFLSYLLYGFFRPFLSREMKRDIEEEEDDESPTPH
jgi:CDP-diacylglycerol--serine O-phosphatidyltransferase